MRLPCLAAAFALLATSAAAQSYPTRPIRMVVPFAAGGSADVVARLFAEPLSIELGQSVVVENRVGAGGNIGADFAAKATADGYTIMMGAPGTLAINEHIYRSMPYDPERDFAMVGLVAIVPNVLVINTAIPATTVQELIAVAKARPGGLNYGTPGPGSTAHLSTELFNAMTGTDIVHVPYKGTAPALQDLITGQIQVMIDGLGPTMPHIKAGTVRALGIATLQRSPLLPELPSISESVPGFQAGSWFGVAVPAATPRPIIDRLNAATNQALTRPELKERLAGLGATIGGGTTADFNSFVRAERAKWKDVAARSGARLD